jgi:hypothetical protein
MADQPVSGAAAVDLPLTGIERRVLALLAEGHTAKTAAVELGSRDEPIGRSVASNGTSVSGTPFAVCFLRTVRTAPVVPSSLPRGGDVGDPDAIGDVRSADAAK